LIERLRSFQPLKLFIELKAHFALEDSVSVENDAKLWVFFLAGKNKKKIADFHVLGLFIAKKHDLSEKKSVCHAPFRCDTNFCRAYSLLLES
jgi:hypothetical protein